MKKVAFIMGSDSDLPVAEKAFPVLEEFGIPYTVRILSAHRTPAEAKAFAERAAEEGYGVIICAAGMAAHLAGAFAANTVLPVIGIPMKSGGLGGLDALLSTVMMPSGVPVATVAIDGAKNAAYLAAEILALGDGALSERLLSARKRAAEDVLKKDALERAKYENTDQILQGKGDKLS